MMAIPVVTPACAALTPLGELVQSLVRVGATLSGSPDVGVRDVCQDSRRVQPGDLFAARAGARAQGADYVGNAIGRGAAAVMVEAGTPLRGVSVPTVEVADLRLAIALAAEAVHGWPSRALSVVGITGTNGKTTTAWLASRAVDGAGFQAATLGTLGFQFESEQNDSPLTTPEADEITRYLVRARDGGASHFVMEVSSHALVQKRVDALSFRVAAFSNLTQDHLDYHGTMQDYAESKARLFCELAPAASVVNVDDPFGTHLATRASGRVVTVGRSGAAAVRPVRSELGADGIRADVSLPSGMVSLRSRLVGEHNLDNLLCALGIVEALELDVERAAEALSSGIAVPGRLERCDAPGDDILVVVDYAHTPDALRRALVAVRALARGQLICLFGCGGDRDPDKRPKMGSAVGELADVAIVSNDNPRSEDPIRIVDQILPGLRQHSARYTIELDRAAAIEQAILRARPGDVVLIAGKGHEPYQLIGPERRDFDDRVEARRALARRRQGSAG